MQGPSERAPEVPLRWVASRGGGGTSAPRRAVALVLLLLILAWSWTLSEVRLQLLFEEPARRAVLAFVRGLFPPDLDAVFLLIALRAAVRTLSIAVCGTVLSVLLGFPLAVLATPALFRRGVLASPDDRGPWPLLLGWASLGAHALLRILRAVPDVLWALLFVVAFGLGPLAGALALGVNYAGVVGRVFADLFDESPPPVLEALHAGGASRLQIFLLAILPQAAPGVLGYALYSFECCVRAASVLGFIGAGGIGYELSVSMRLFEYGQLSTLLAVWLVLILATDWLSRRLRRGLRRAGESRVATIAPPDSGPAVEGTRARPGLARTPGRLLLVLGVAAVGLSLADAGFFAAADAPNAVSRLARLARFAGQLIPPDLSWPFLRTLGAPLAQTVAISIVGTLFGLLLGGALAVPAISTLAFDPPEEPGRLRGLGQLTRAALYTGARTTLALLRAIPELLWVLLCIIAVGLGPFAGALALGLHTAGVLGKLFAETLEEVEPRSLLALRATGAGRLQILLCGMLPQARGTLSSYLLLRWENNLRASAVVGLVGGGGLGLLLHNSVQLAFYPRVATLVLLVYGLVAGTDLVSERLRAATRQLEPERRLRRARQLRIQGA